MRWPISSRRCCSRGCAHEQPDGDRADPFGQVLDAGKLDQIGLLVDLSDTPGVIQGRPMIVGEHTQQILAELGYDEAQIKLLEEQFAIGFAGMPRMPPRKAA
mgnify:CR=1 FL=1